MIKVSIQIISLYPYHIIEAIFSRMNLCLSQKSFSDVYILTLKVWFRSNAYFELRNREEYLLATTELLHT